MKTSSKRSVLCFILLMSVMTLSGCRDKTSDNIIPEFMKKINAFVGDKTFQDDNLFYDEENDTKVCVAEYNGLNICYYAENNEDIYAVVTKNIDEYKVEFTYKRSDIRVGISGDTLQYWCKVDYNLIPVSVDEEIYYNRIVYCISEEQLCDINNSFNEYTQNLMEWRKYED